MSRTPAEAFGELVLQRGWASRDQIDRCLKELSGTADPKPRLGQLLIQQGILTPQQVTDILSMQSKELFLCSQCACRYNVVFWSPGKKVSCPACRIALVRLTHLHGISADESILCE